jgi:hypothetical protein
MACFGFVLVVFFHRCERLRIDCHVSRIRRLADGLVFLKQNGADENTLRLTGVSGRDGDLAGVEVAKAALRAWSNTGSENQDWPRSDRPDELDSKGNSCRDSPNRLKAIRCFRSMTLSARFHTLASKPRLRTFVSTIFATLRLIGSLIGIVMR